jgi:hypothetical protein
MEQKRRPSEDGLLQRRQQHQLDRIGHADAKALPGLGRIEMPPALEHLAQLGQLGDERRRLAKAGRGGAHQLAVTHEQRIAQLLAQTTQRVAHRRRRQGQGLGRAGQVLLAVDHLEHPQQVEIHGFARTMNRFHTQRLKQITSFTV